MTPEEGRALIGEERIGAGGEPYRCVALYFRSVVVVDSRGPGEPSAEIVVQAVNQKGLHISWVLTEWRELRPATDTTPGAAPEPFALR